MIFLKRIGFVTVFVFMFILVSCSNSDSTPSCRLVSFDDYGVYYDEIKNGYYSFDPSYSGKFNLEYENNIISIIHGGLKNLSLPGNSNISFSQSDDVHDNLVYNANSITVNNYHLYSKEFVIVDGKLVSQNIEYSNYLPDEAIEDYSPGLHTYEYVGNKIIEKVGSFTRRIFYIENGNLAKIDWFFGSSPDVIYKKKEYLFTNYDSTPNLLKGKFYINGFFFKAFSNNNYRKIEINTYDFNNGVYELNQGQYSFFNYGEFTTDMFIQDCQ